MFTASSSVLEEEDNTVQPSSREDMVTIVNTKGKHLLVYSRSV